MLPTAAGSPCRGRSRARATRPYRPAAAAPADAAARRVRPCDDPRGALSGRRRILLVRLPKLSRAISPAGPNRLCPAHPDGPGAPPLVPGPQIGGRGRRRVHGGWLRCRLADLGQNADAAPVTVPADVADCQAFAADGAAVADAAGVPALRLPCLVSPGRLEELVSRLTAEVAVP